MYYPGGRSLPGVVSLLVISMFLAAASCNEHEVNPPEQKDTPKDTTNTGNTDPNPADSATYLLPQIDLSHWKVTIPIGDPVEVMPPEILKYATNKTLQPFMYNDSTDGSLVFYAYPAQSTTNSKYSRTELREQLVPGSNSTNWTFEQGGKMKGKLRMAEITKDSKGKYHRAIIMQIHGRLSDEQRDLIGKSDNDAPPILKIYWQNEKIRVLTKVLKDPSQTDLKYILSKDSWEDDAGFYFDTPVGFDEFTLEVIVSKGRLEVKLNDSESKIYEGPDMDKWAIFENYFKAGNYFQTLDEGAYARVKYYELEVSH